MALMSKSFYFIVASLIIIQGCKDCGPNVSLGEYPLSELSKDFVPYRGLDSLIFMDQDSNLIKFTAPNGRVTEDVALIDNVTCTSGFIEQYEFYESERQFLLYERANDPNSEDRIDVQISTLIENGFVIQYLINVVKDAVDPVGLAILIDDNNRAVLNEDVNFGNISRFGFDFDNAYFNEDAQNNNYPYIIYSSTKGIELVAFSADSYWKAERSRGNVLVPLN
jgi:hypothetical protein